MNIVVPPQTRPRHANRPGAGTARLDSATGTRLRATLPPPGLISVALLPDAWKMRLLEMNIEPLRDERLAGTRAFGLSDEPPAYLERGEEPGLLCRGAPVARGPRNKSEEKRS